MVRRQIDLDEESDQILARLAEDYEGDLGKALGNLLHAHESMEDFVDLCEQAHEDRLLTPKERVERRSDEGRFTVWEAVKRRHNL